MADDSFDYTPIINGIIAYTSANNMANATQDAANTQASAYQQGIDVQYQMWEQMRQDFLPAMQAGAQGISQLTQYVPQYMQQTIAPLYNEYMGYGMSAMPDPNAYTINPVTGEMGRQGTLQRTQAVPGVNANFLQQQQQQQQQGPIQAAQPYSGNVIGGAINQVGGRRPMSRGMSDGHGGDDGTGGGGNGNSPGAATSSGGSSGNSGQGSGGYEADLGFSGVNTGRSPSGGVMGAANSDESPSNPGSQASASANSGFGAGMGPGQSQTNTALGLNTPNMTAVNMPTSTMSVAEAQANLNGVAAQQGISQYGKPGATLGTTALGPVGGLMGYGLAAALGLAQHGTAVDGVSNTGMNSNEGYGGGPGSDSGNMYGIPGSLTPTQGQNLYNLMTTPNPNISQVINPGPGVDASQMFNYSPLMTERYVGGQAATATPEQLAQGGVLSPTVPTLPGQVDFNFNESDPVYQWKLQQQQEAVNRGLASRGLYNSRPGMDILSDNQMNLISSEADKQFARQQTERNYSAQAAKDTYGMQSSRGDTLYNRINQQQGTLYDRLLNNATQFDSNNLNQLLQRYNLGQNAYSGLYNWGADMAKLGTGASGSVGQGSIATGQGVANQFGNMGEALAQGNLLNGNTWSNFYSGLGNLFNNQQTPQAQQNQQSSYSGFNTYYS